MTGIHNQSVCDKKQSSKRIGISFVLTGILHFRFMRDSIVYLCSEGRKSTIKVDLDTSASRLKEIINVVLLSCPYQRLFLVFRFICNACTSRRFVCIVNCVPFVRLESVMDLKLIFAFLEKLPA